MVNKAYSHSLCSLISHLCPHTGHAPATRNSPQPATGNALQSPIPFVPYALLHLAKVSLILVLEVGQHPRGRLAARYVITLGL